MWHYRLKRASEYGRLARKHRKVYRRSMENTPKVPMLFISFAGGVLVFIPGIIITVVPHYAFGHVHNTMIYDYMGPLCLVVSLFLFIATVVAWMRQRRKVQLLRALLEDNDDEREADQEILYNRVRDSVRVGGKIRKHERIAEDNEKSKDENEGSEMLELDAVQLQLPPSYRQSLHEGNRLPPTSLGAEQETRAPPTDDSSPRGNDNPTVVYDV